MQSFHVRQVAVLGAGVMGAQIAAHLVNVRVPVILFDLPAKPDPQTTASPSSSPEGTAPSGKAASAQGPKSAIAMKAIDGLKKIKPAPLALAEEAARIQPANYEEHLALLQGCDLIIEAIAERMDWKHDLYAKIAPHIAPGAILASNTSGLSITQLAQGLPAELQQRFCGIHFFNPPRYMSLVELIPTPSTNPAILDQLETFATSTLGKGVVRAKDTPNFIANRVGIFNILATMHQAQAFGLSVDLVDDLTGKKLGRASSGTFRTADVVGLDTLVHVIKTMQDNLGPDKASDPFYPRYSTPPVLSGLIAQGALGQKTSAGFYKKVGRDIQRLDPTSAAYVAGGAVAEPIIDRILKKPAAERLKLLRESSNPQAQFLWAIQRDLFHYVALHLADIADNAREVDFAMRWGFGMQQGPFELWQAGGWAQVAQWVQADIDAGKALANAPLPAWVFSGPVATQGGVHGPAGSWSPARQAFVPSSTLPVYQRQHFPETVLGSGALPALQAGTEVFKNDELRVWTLDGELLIASITAKLHLISPQVTAGLHRAIELAEASYRGLVIWSPDDVFSAGANLEALMPVFMKAGGKGIAPEQKKLQDLMLRLRYAAVPTVAAIRGLALGGGCELALHCARRVVAMESYIGLVEIGVGLLPGGGGLTYLARRAAELAAAAPGSDVLAFLKEGFSATAMATVGTSALEGRKLGYLRDDDIISAHKDELLFIALSQARALADAGWRPPPRALFPAAGRSALATIKVQLVGMRDGALISAHDFHVASAIATVLCGGDIEAGSLVDEAYLMALERQHFCALLDHPKTQERIMGMLSTGKPLRN